MFVNDNYQSYRLIFIYNFPHSTNRSRKGIFCELTVSIYCTIIVYPVINAIQKATRNNFFVLCGVYGTLGFNRLSSPHKSMLLPLETLNLFCILLYGQHAKLLILCPPYGNIDLIPYQIHRCNSIPIPPVLVYL